MKAFEVMKNGVISVRPETTLKEIARIMSEHRISGVPVVDEEDCLLGMVGQGDLFLKEQGVPFSRERLPALFNQFINPENLPETYQEARGLTAADVMNRNVTAVDVGDDVGHVAETMMRCGLRRVPVLSEGKLAGIISRADIVSLLVEAD